MPSRKIEQQLEKLSGLHAHAPDEATLAALREALANPVNVVAAKAARIAGDLGTQSLLPELLSAFHRMFENPRQTDPQCWGKNALAKALKDLRHAGSQEFLRGLHHVQMEPVWGGQEDTATVLRGACALALAQCTDITRQAVIRHLIDAFTDETATVRADIARALEQMEGEEACLLLRLKALLGDKEPAVTGQVLESLLRLEHAAAVPFVAKVLAGGGEVAEEAALALVRRASLQHWRS
jgi:HEAT repeat protein